MKDDDDKPAKDDDEVIDEGKKFLKHCIEQDGDNHANGLDDIRFLSGDQWDEKDKRARSIPGAERPCLTINKLPTFLHQVTNDLRQNVPGIKVSPVADGADEDTAKVVQGMIRHMEYSSNAEVAYDTAVGSAAAIGFGYFRLTTDYERPDSFDQDIRFKRIRNPFTVYFDPASEEPDGSDAKRCMITSKMDKAAFKLAYPKAEGSYENFETGPGDPNQEWLGQDYVRVAEYYRIVMTPDTLVQLSNGETGFKSKLIEMPPGVTIARERETERRTVEWYKLTALEILETVEIKCDWIPVFPVYGDEYDIDGKVMRSGLVRNAKDPGRMYNYWMTAATEEVAMRNKTPYIGAEGAFEGYEDDWASANVGAFPYLEYKPVTIDGSLAPPPSRQPMADVPQGILAMAMHANDNIKATTGLFDSSLGAKGTATSGIQERAQQRQGDISNFHYADNLARTIRHAGRCIVSMIPHYYDATRVVKIMGDDDTLDHATINQPNPNPQPDPETGAIQLVLNDLTVGEYDITVSTGPSYSTLRQEAADAMVQFGKSWPKLMDVAGDKVVAAMDWPGAEGIASRIKATIPPNILATDPENRDKQQPMVQTSQGPVPIDQAGQMMDQMHQQMQQMGQALQEAKAGITKVQLETASRERIAQMGIQAKVTDNQSYHETEVAKKAADIQHGAAAQAAADNTKLDIAELQAMTALLVAQAKQPPALAADNAKTLSGSASAPAATPTAEDATKRQLAGMVRSPNAKGTP